MTPQLEKLLSYLLAAALYAGSVYLPAVKEPLLLIAGLILGMPMASVSERMSRRPPKS
jgi:hypothetical protein